MVDEVDEVEESQVTNKRSRSCKYKTEEGKYFCEAWLTISLDAMVGADQTKEKFWQKIKEYYNNNVTIPSNCIIGPLSHCWTITQEQ